MAMARMNAAAAPLILLGLFIVLAVVPAPAAGEDPYLFFTWNVTYGTIRPLGKPQRGILINNQFPGPNINSTTNNNIVLNVFNNLDEPLLFTWNGIQQRKNSWMDGMIGTQCPIAPGTNFTYKFQVKDQIGSYMYFPSTGLQRFAGGFGGLRVNSRLLIPVPFDPPEADYTVMAGDWYVDDHAALRKHLTSGRPLTRPDGILINGFAGKADGVRPRRAMFNMKAGKVYRYRVCNVGFKNSLNFRIQGHSLKLVEMDGSHTVQNVYESIDVHVGQCYSALVTANKPVGDYYLVVSSRFTKYDLSSAAVVRYVGSKTAPSPVVPKAPVGWLWSLNQFRSFRWNLTASAARPNPQGSYHYGQINITRTVKLVSSAGKDAAGKLRYALNGFSHTPTSTPLKLAEYFGIANKVFKYNLIPDDGTAAAVGATVTTQPIVVNFTFRNFMEIVFENHEKSVQTYHLHGYSFFPVGMEPGKWTPASRKYYNNLDAVSRHSIQVFPGSWTAILLTFDNAGMWNLRSCQWERYYLGQQMYISVLSPNKSLRDEYNMPESALVCGLVKGLPRPNPYS